MELGEVRRRQWGEEVEWRVGVMEMRGGDRRLIETGWGGGGVGGRGGGGNETSL